MLRLVFMGSDPIALPALDWIAGSGGEVARVVGVYTQPDRPSGRGQKIHANGIKRWAQARGIPIFQPERPGPEDARRLVDLTTDVSLVMAYGHLLRREILDAPRHGMLNLHASLLPKYRGASPIQTAIASGERETGVSLMRIVERMDAGPIADIERIPIAPLDTATEVEARLAAACVPLVDRALRRLASRSIEFREQDEPAATYCRRLEKADGVLDFRRPAAELAARVNGLAPWPGTVISAGGQEIRIGLADAADGTLSAAPGSVLGADSGGLLVATALGAVRFRRLQRAGGRMLPAADFLRGFPIPPGTTLASVPMPQLVSRTPFPRPRRSQQP